MVRFPQPLQERFRGRRFIPLDPPDFLDHVGAEILLVGARRSVAALGLRLEPEHESEAEAEIFKELGLEKERRQVRGHLGDARRGRGDVRVRPAHVGEGPDETLNLGLWIELEFVSETGPAENLFPDLSKEKPRRLVRWEFIRAAEMFEDVPGMQRDVDFQPRAA